VLRRSLAGRGRGGPRAYFTGEPAVYGASSVRAGGSSASATLSAGGPARGLAPRRREPEGNDRHGRRGL